MKDLKQIKRFNEHQENLNISDVSKSFLFCLEKAMGYAYASATEGVTRKEAQEDFRKYREEMLVEFQKRNVC
jgi:hypothetical protein